MGVWVGVGGMGVLVAVDGMGVLVAVGGMEGAQAASMSAANTKIKLAFFMNRQSPAVIWGQERFIIRFRSFDDSGTLFLHLLLFLPREIFCACSERYSNSGDEYKNSLQVVHDAARYCKFDRQEYAKRIARRMEERDEQETAARVVVEPGIQDRQGRSLTVSPLPRVSQVISSETKMKPQPTVRATAKGTLSGRTPEFDRSIVQV